MHLVLDPSLSVGEKLDKLMSLGLSFLHCKIRALLSWGRVAVTLKWNNASKAVCTQYRLKEERKFCGEVTKRTIFYAVVGSIRWNLVEFDAMSLERKRQVFRESRGPCGKREKVQCCHRNKLTCSVVLGTLQSSCTHIYFF
uniref:Uncharacterized protein n=1 Tax=Molossus molossus TaxID=27622 RepID=A0A7J8GQY9_MOLMO|nr:hypothetical protein HJG59_011361 [Molossus molossus]